MKKTAYVLAGILLLSMVATVFGGSWRGSGGWGPPREGAGIVLSRCAEALTGRCHSRECGSPGTQTRSDSSADLDARLRGHDGKVSFCTRQYYSSSGLTAITSISTSHSGRASATTTRPVNTG